MKFKPLECSTVKYYHFCPEVFCYEQFVFIKKVLQITT